MAVDYDLVILGGTVEGRRAAIKAVRYGARVALVEVPGLFEANQRQRYVLQALQQLGQGLQRQKVGQWFGLGSHGGRGSDRTGAEDALEWPAVLEWSAIAAETQLGNLSAEVMAHQGVDVVMEVPERLSRGLARRGRQGLVVTTAGRRLRSRGVLAAFGRSPDALEPLMCADALPTSAIILGGNTRSIEWAQALSSVGVAVTVQAATVLPGWDEKIRALVRSQLITSGIRISDAQLNDAQLNDAQLNDAQSIEAPHDTQVNVQPVNGPSVNGPSVNGPSVVECTLPLDTESPALSLPQFVDGLAHGLTTYLSVNNRLQSAHPRVFACGSLLGGSADAGLAECEAEIAVKNALFLPRHRADSPALAQGSDYFARVGLSESQAQQRYGLPSIHVWEASDGNSTDLSGAVPLRQYCKIICCHQQIVGIYLFGEASLDLAQSLTVMMGRSIHEINSVVFPSRGLLAVVTAASELAVRPRWQVGRWPRDWAENWFNWRRSA